MTVSIAKTDATDALQQHLQALSLPGWQQLRLFPVVTTKSALTKTVRTWSTQKSMADLIRKQNGSRREKLDVLQKLVAQVGRSKEFDPYVFGDEDREHRCQEIRRVARELLEDFGWPQKKPPKRGSFLAGLPNASVRGTASSRTPGWHRLNRRVKRDPSEDGLRYHQAVFDLLNVKPEMAQRSVNGLRSRQKKCGVKLPASVYELFSQRYVHDIFCDTTNQDSLVELSGLGKWLEEKAGVKYLNVAIENQGMVTWYVPIGRADDPPVLQAPDGDFFEAVVVSNAFRPRTRHRDSIAYRFFIPGGVLRIFSNTRKDRDAKRGEWTIAAETSELLFELAREVWLYADVSKKIKASSNAERRSREHEVLEKLRRSHQRVDSRTS